MPEMNYNVSSDKGTKFKNNEAAASVNRTGVPDKMKRQYEAVSGLSMDDVRVHYNSGMPEKAGALAYTQGSNIYVAPGQEKHLKHELGHVIQQKKGIVRPTNALGGVAINDDERLEKEADDYGRAADSALVSSNSAPVLKYDFKTIYSQNVMQFKPVRDKERGLPFFVDDKNYAEDEQKDKLNGRFRLMLFVEMDDYVVFQIVDHTRRIFWKKANEWERLKNGEEFKSTDGELDKYYEDRSFEHSFNVKEFLKIQPLSAWLEEYQEIGAVIDSINASGLDDEEKTRRKNALINYVFQRYIVNALYRAEELDRMEYSGSPFSYQDRSTYMRSQAGSYANALKMLLLEKMGENNKISDKVLLTRGKEMRDELDKFFLHIDLRKLSHGEKSTETKIDIDEFQHSLEKSDVIEKLTKFLEAMNGLSADGMNTMFREYANLNPVIFADATDLLQNVNLAQDEKFLEKRLKELSRFKENVQRAVFDKVAEKLGITEKADIDEIWQNGQGKSDSDKKTAAKEKLKLIEKEELLEFLYWHGQVLSERAEEIKNEINKIEEIMKKKAAEKEKKVYANKLEGMRKSLTACNNKIAYNKEDIDKVNAQEEGEEREFKSNIEEITSAYIRWKYLKVYNKHKEKAIKLEALSRNMNLVMITGGMVSLGAGGISQSALLLEDTKLSSLAATAINKTGYVPSVTESIRTMLEYREGGEEKRDSLSMSDMAVRIFDRQKNNWSKREDSPEYDAIKKDLEENKSAWSSISSQYAESDPERARDFAKVFFESFCYSLVESFYAQKDENKRIYLQASVVKKMIEGCRLFENKRIPAFVWYQLAHYLEAAESSKNRLVDFVRQIQAIHEIILLGIELQGGSAAVRKEEGISIDTGGWKVSEDEYFRGAYLADYGLKAFAQAYDAAVDQYNGDNPVESERPLNVVAFYNIYFELTDKLRATTGAGNRKVNLDTPSSVDDYLKSLKELPDIIMIDIHPNDATKKKIVDNDIIALLNKLDAIIGEDKKKRITVMIDITLNQATDEEVHNIRTKAGGYIEKGWLNLVFVQSLTKFAQMGMDKHSGGLIFSFNKEADKSKPDENEKYWEAYNESLRKMQKTSAVDPYMREYFQLLFETSSEEQRGYIEIIRDNTRYVQEKLQEKIGEETIQLSENTDTGSCYVAWYYRESYAIIRNLYQSIYNQAEEFVNTKTDIAPENKAEEINSIIERNGILPLYKLHEFNEIILENGINKEMSKTKLPVAMRFSFGFPISNLGETGDEVRFTIGVETKKELDKYIDVIYGIDSKMWNLIFEAYNEWETASDLLNLSEESKLRILLNSGELKKYIEG